MLLIASVPFAADAFCFQRHVPASTKNVEQRQHICPRRTRRAAENCNGDCNFLLSTEGPRRKPFKIDLVCPRRAAKNISFDPRRTLRSTKNGNGNTFVHGGHGGPRRTATATATSFCPRRAAKNIFCGRRRSWSSITRITRETVRFCPQASCFCHIVSSLLQTSTEPSELAARCRLESRRDDCARTYLNSLRRQGIWRGRCPGQAGVSPASGLHALWIGPVSQVNAYDAGSGHWRSQDFGPVTGTARFYHISAVPGQLGEITDSPGLPQGNRI